jgi:hypothetical protein
MRQESWAAYYRRIEREEVQRRKELAKEQKRQTAWAEQRRSEYEVQVYENQIQFLLSMHKDCGPTWDWQLIARSAEPAAPVPNRVQEEHVARTSGTRLPAQPVRQRTFENGARLALDTYMPTFFERAFGGDKKRRAVLEAAVPLAAQQDELQFNEAQQQYAAHVAAYNAEIENARRADAAAFEKACEEHRQQLERHRAVRQIAAQVLDSKIEAYRAVVNEVEPFSELIDSGMSMVIETLRADLAVVECRVKDGAVVPRERKELSAAGKLVTKSMPPARIWEIYQDYVCGSALRIARELFATLPFSRVVVNVGISTVDTATGHETTATILAVSVAREIAERLKFENLDPSDSLANFDYRMKFKKSSGFEPVDPITADEQFLTSVKKRAR